MVASVTVPRPHVKPTKFKLDEANSSFPKYKHMHTPKTAYNAAEVNSAPAKMYLVCLRSDGRTVAMSPGTECWNSIEKVIVETTTPKPDQFGAHEKEPEMKGGLLFVSRDRSIMCIATPLLLRLHVSFLECDGP